MTSKQSLIHPTAIIEEGVELGDGVTVGPYAHIMSGAKIGARSKIHSHVVIWGACTMGEDNEIFPFCTLAPPPQIIGDLSPEGKVVIGNKNIIRERVEIHRGSKKENLLTSVGNENYIMSNVHIAHDCVVGSHIVIASKTGLAGHSKISDFAVVSGGCGISQFVRVGSYTFCAGHTRFEKDLPPFLCAKEFSEVTGPNLVGMKRAGFSTEDIRVVKEIYKGLYVEKGLYREQLEKLKERFAGQAVFETFYTFVTASKVGIMRNA